MGQKCGRDTIFYSQNYPIFQLGTQLMYIFQPCCIYFRVMQLHSNKWYVDKKWPHKNLFLRHPFSSFRFNLMGYI